MAAKKMAETVSKKLASELAAGDKFRSSENDLWQEIVSLEKSESDKLEEDQVTKKEIISCETKLEGSVEKFRFTAFANVEVEVLNG